MNFISTSDAPAPAGHYSQATQVRGLLFISGQLPIDPVSGQLVNGPVEEQARRTLLNLRGIVEAAGGSLTNIAKVTVYITDIADWPKVNAVYAEIFGGHRPARAVIPCGPLHHGARIEIEGVAALA